MSDSILGWPARGEFPVYSRRYFYGVVAKETDDHITLKGAPRKRSKKPRYFTFPRDKVTLYSPPSNPLPTAINPIAVEEAVDLIQRTLFSCDDLRLPQFRGQESYFAGHCYIASEAVYHLTGRRLTIWRMRLGETTHWFLKDGEKIVDPTAEQFDQPPPYGLARRCGFLTRTPCKRTLELIRRLGAS